MKTLSTSKNYAVFSDCEKYRYQLWRIWDISKPSCMFLMHNPSTADDINDDPTIRRCIGFAKSWGYGGIAVGNLSPYRATNPKDLISLSSNVLLPAINNHFIKSMAMRCAMHVLAYGNPIKEDMIRYPLGIRWHYLKLNKSGHPSHPLYLKKDLKPELALPF